MHFFKSFKCQAFVLMAASFLATLHYYRCIDIASTLSTLHQHCIKIASTLHQRWIDISTLHQHCINIASMLHQHCINVASTLHQCCIIVASTLHHHFHLMAYHINYIIIPSSAHQHCIIIARSFNAACMLSNLDCTMRKYHLNLCAEELDKDQGWNT